MIRDAESGVLLVVGSLLIGSVLGCVLGATQWLALDRALPGIRASRWIGATAAGMGAGLLAVATVLYLVRPGDPLGGLSPGASQGVLAITVAQVLLVMFVWHRQGLGTAWGPWRLRAHWGAVAAIAFGVSPALLPHELADLLILDTLRLHQAIAAGMLAALVLFVAGHHFTDRQPRTLGRKDLPGALLVSLAMLHLATYLFRSPDLYQFTPGEPYGLPNSTALIVALGAVGAVAGMAQGLVLRKAGARAWAWSAACGLGLALGLAIGASLVPQLGPSMMSTMRLAAVGGVAEIFFFAPVGLVFGALTGHRLLRSTGREARVVSPD